MTDQDSQDRVHHLAIAVGLVAGLTLGILATATGSDSLTRFAKAFRPIGTALVNAIRMVVIPLWSC